jgi:hypothetical protein
MVNQARLKLFGRGEPVIEEGAAGESMFVMLRGAANVLVQKMDRRSKSQRWGRAIVSAKCRCSLANRAAHRPRRRRLLRHGNRKTVMAKC